MAQTIVQSECEGLPAPGRRRVGAEAGTASSSSLDRESSRSKRLCQLVVGCAGLGGAQVQERCGLAQSGQRGPGERGEG